MNITKETIQEWKKKYGTIHKLSVDDKVAYLKTPDRKTLSYATSIATKDPLKFNEVLLNNCWLGGDEEIKTDDSLFLSASAKLADLIEVKEASLEKI